MQNFFGSRSASDKDNDLKKNFANALIKMIGSAKNVGKDTATSIQEMLRDETISCPEQFDGQSWPSLCFD